MVPAVQNGATIRVEMGEDCIFTPNVGDIVLIRNFRSAIPLIKSVYATPGQRFEWGETGHLMIDGIVIKNSAEQTFSFSVERQRLIQLYIDDYEGKVPKNTFLLLGENPSGSLDSSQFGLIHRDDIIGRMVK